METVPSIKAEVYSQQNSSDILQCCVIPCKALFAPLFCLYKLS